VTGDDDDAGEAVGLGDVAGALTVGLGEAAGADVVLVGVLVGVLVLVAGSHAVAKTVARIVGSRSARLIDLIAGLLIDFPRSSKIEKREDNCSNAEELATGVPTDVMGEAALRVN
jgi:hypothetical protein